VATMDSSRMKAAQDQARAAAAKGPASAPADGRARTRHVAIGDPQAPFDTFLRVLDVHGLLGDDGRLKPEVALVSMGDHFDWGGPADRARAAESGLHLLAWLAAHPEDQIVILLGNHDLGRVCELADFDDAAFAQAQREADAIYLDEDYDEEDDATEARFLEKYPRIPNAELVSRDFGTFTAAQRDWVTHLLRVRRFRAAHAHGEDLLLCHAGVTREDLAGVGVPPERQHRAPEVAAALNARVDDLVSRWTGGYLDLGALHKPGYAHHPGGRGIFYQRPAHPAVHLRKTDFDGPPRRRYDPHHLPEGLLQGIGHIRDNKCRLLLGSWAKAEEAKDGPLRHLRVREGNVSYARGLPGDVSPRDATMLFLDSAMNHVPPESYELLDLDTRTVLPKR